MQFGNAWNFTSKNEITLEERKGGSMRNILVAALALVCLAATPAFSLSDGPYISPANYDVIHVLAPPPTPGSEAERKDMDAVLEAQRISTPERMHLAETDATAGLDAFAGVLGVDPGKLPGVAAFVHKAEREAQFATTIGKDCWERPRPFVLDSRIHPPGRMESEVASRPGEKNTAPHDPSSPCPPLTPTPAYSYSYPSGHSTRGALDAILLAQMVPEKRAEIFARGWDFGVSRVVGGVHYPSDVEAGRIDATAIASIMMQNRDFQSDLAAARAELREAMRLER
jgi:acid phosphatase (class A)